MELLAGGTTHVGYLLKDRVLDRSTLMAALWRVHAGDVVVDPILVRSLLDAPTVPPTLVRLSDTSSTGSRSQTPPRTTSEYEPYCITCKPTELHLTTD
jgi:hypothetical protein